MIVQLAISRRSHCDTTRRCKAQFVPQRAAQRFRRGRILYDLRIGRTFARC